MMGFNEDSLLVILLTVYYILISGYGLVNYENPVLTLVMASVMCSVIYVQNEKLV